MESYYEFEDRNYDTYDLNYMHMVLGNLWDSCVGVLQKNVVDAKTRETYVFFITGKPYTRFDLTEDLEESMNKVYQLVKDGLVSYK